MNVTFAGEGSGTAPLTWGQSAIWDAVQRTAPDDHYFNFGRVLRVPGSPSPEDVAAALGWLIERHGALRTRLDSGGDQRLYPGGSLPLLVTDADPDDVLAELAATRFDYRHEWPLRVAAIVDGATVTHVVLVFCHLAADGAGAEVAIRDLRMFLLRGRLVGPAAPQALHLARWQAGAEGRRVAEAAAEHWEREGRRMPTTMFDHAGPAADPPIWRALLRSPALGLAVRQVARTHATSTSTVLLTAVARLAAEVEDRETAAVLPIVSNRFRRDTIGLVSTLSMEGLFTLDVDRPFPDLLRAAGPAALRAYRSAYHDPADRARVVQAESERRGAEVHPRCCFNDMRFADPGPKECTAEELDKALAETDLAWPMSQDKLNCRFCVHVTTEGVSLTADTRYLPRTRMEQYLLDLETLLVAEARR
ncbi:MAG: non-ribosomal peptide synthetase condensation domain protein [Nonomuraea sp.]|nr:non-ribosomal peptide synthetase condensation domain protein [Nonomuraea sp.]